PFASQRPQLRIKKMRTRWGSLSQRGYINLNLALMQLPEHLLELVVVHELCHLKHFDHGPGFRALMSQCLPDWRVREQQLSQLRSEEHTSELQSRENLVCRLLLEKKKKTNSTS